jgi:hypothetical protein
MRRSFCQVGCDCRLKRAHKEARATNESPRGRPDCTAMMSVPRQAVSLVLMALAFARNSDEIKAAPFPESTN